MVDKFLDMFRTLEKLLDEKYHHRRRHFSSVVIEYINDPESEPFREELDVCREVRNLLTHSASIEGLPPVTPSQPLVDTLQSIIDYIQAPPMAMNVATPSSKLLTTHPNQRVLGVMQKMKDRGYSHVPVIDYGKFVGMFSVSTPFAHALENPSKGIGTDSRIGDFGRWLEIDEHPTERFEFMARDTDLNVVRKAFDTVGSDRKRLAMTMITENDRQNETILGVITPWDVMKK